MIQKIDEMAIINLRNKKLEMVKDLKDK